jgi:hypothetical protein
MLQEFDPKASFLLLARIEIQYQFLRLVSITDPIWLKLVAQTINNLFNGKVAQYLSYEPVFLSEELTLLLQQNYQRLSECEKQAMVQLSNQTKIASINQVLENCQGSRADVFKAIQSLVRRGLISTNFRNNETVFTVIPIVKEYVKIVNL